MTSLSSFISSLKVVVDEWKAERDEIWIRSFQHKDWDRRVLELNEAQLRKEQRVDKILRPFLWNNKVERAWDRTSKKCSENSNWAQCARCVYNKQCKYKI